MNLIHLWKMTNNLMTYWEITRKMFHNQVLHPLIGINARDPLADAG